MTDVSKIIKDNGLQPGQLMKNIHGDDIPGSLVIDNYTALVGTNDGFFTLYNTRPISGATTEIRLSQSAVDIIRNSGPLES